MMPIDKKVIKVLFRSHCSHWWYKKQLVLSQKM